MLSKEISAQRWRSEVGEIVFVVEVYLSNLKVSFALEGSFGPIKSSSVSVGNAELLYEIGRDL